MDVPTVVDVAESAPSVTAYHGPVPQIDVREAELADAEVLLALMQAAFGARPPVDPPSEALGETAESLRAALTSGTGVLVSVDDEPAATLLIDSTRRAEDDQPIPDHTVVLRRVSVHPEFQGAGVAQELVAAAEHLAALDGARRVELFSRREFPELVAWWQQMGYQPQRTTELGVVLGRDLPIVIEVPTAEQMHELGLRLASVLRAGDLIIASGELGAGKTTLTQGLARGLQVGGPVISPTFVLSRVHPSLNAGPDLVHVDAYRLDSPEEFDDLDLDESYATAVTVVEWGLGLAEQANPDHLHIHIDRAEDDCRWVLVHPHGGRWTSVDLHQLLGGSDG